MYPPVYHNIICIYILQSICYGSNLCGGVCMDSEGNGRCLIGDWYIEETSSCRDSYDRLLLCYESGPIPPPDCSAISFLQGIMSRAGIKDISIEGLIRRGLLIRMGNNILVTNAFEMLTSNRGGPVINLCTMRATTYIARYFQGVLLLDATTPDSISCRSRTRSGICMHPVSI